MIPAAFPTVKGLLIGLAVVAMVAPVTYCKGRDDGKAAITAKIAKANQKAAKLNLEVHDAVAERRVIDLTANTKQELSDAQVVAENPGGVLPPSAVALACERVRRSRADGAELPPGCGPQGGK